MLTHSIRQTSVSCLLGLEGLDLRGGELKIDLLTDGGVSSGASTIRPVLLCGYGFEDLRGQISEVRDPLLVVLGELVSTTTSSSCGMA